MKIFTRAIFILLCLLPILSFGQKSKWMISFKINILYAEIEDDFFLEDVIITIGGLQFIRPFDIHRETKPKLGWNFGMTRRFPLIDDFYFLTGIETIFSRFEKQE